MEITEWLEKHKMSLRQLAEKAQIGQSTLYGTFRRKGCLRLETARKIHDATGGEVSIQEAMKPKNKNFRDSRKRKEMKIVCPECGAEISLQNKLQIHLDMNGTLSSQ